MPEVDLKILQVIVKQFVFHMEEQQQQEEEQDIAVHKLGSLEQEGKLLEVVAEIKTISIAKIATTCTTTTTNY